MLTVLFDAKTLKSVAVSSLKCLYIIFIAFDPSPLNYNLILLSDNISIYSYPISQLTV